MARNDGKSEKNGTTTAIAPPPPVEVKVVEVKAVDANVIAQALAAPFDATEVKFKPQTVSGNRALAVPFVDARVIQDRLDEVLGVMGWQDSYECLPEGSVVCKLQIRVGSEWIAKEDVGGQSEQPDEGDRRKAAFSDALKRAAVKFGIGRYLYRFKPQWVDFDAQKRQFVRPPALPGVTPPPPVETAPAEKAAGKAKAAEADGKAQRGKPTNGLELHRRLHDKDEQLAREGLCKPGELVKHVVAAGVKAGHDREMTAWTGDAIQLAIDATRAFEAERRSGRKEVA